MVSWCWWTREKVEKQLSNCFKPDGVDELYGPEEVERALAALKTLEELRFNPPRPWRAHKKKEDQPQQVDEKGNPRPMTAKERTARRRERMAGDGFVRLDAWCHPDHQMFLSQMAASSAANLGISQILRRSPAVREFIHEPASRRIRRLAAVASRLRRCLAGLRQALHTSRAQYRELKGRYRDTRETFHRLTIQYDEALEQLREAARRIEQQTAAHEVVLIEERASYERLLGMALLDLRGVAATLANFALKLGGNLVRLRGRHVEPSR